MRCEQSAKEQISERAQELQRERGEMEQEIKLSKQQNTELQERHLSLQELQNQNCKLEVKWSNKVGIMEEKITLLLWVTFPKITAEV